MGTVFIKNACIASGEIRECAHILFLLIPLSEKTIVWDNISDRLELGVEFHTKKKCHSGPYSSVESSYARKMTQCTRADSPGRT